MAKGGFKKKFKKNKSLTKQVESVAKTVKDLQNKEELKYLDTYINAQLPAITGLLTLLNGMILGSTPGTRQANEISCTSIQFRASYRVDDAYTIAGPTYRHLIVWDAQSNGASPTLGDILDQSVIVNPMLAPYKREYQKRFKILYDKAGSMNTTHAYSSEQTAGPPITTTTTEVYEYMYYAKGKVPLSRVTKYRNAQNTGTITDIATNSLFSIWVCPTNSVNLTCGYRLYYKDD